MSTTGPTRILYIGGCHHFENRLPRNAKVGTPSSRLLFLGGFSQQFRFFLPQFLTLHFLSQMYFLKGENRETFWIYKFLDKNCGDSNIKLKNPSESWWIFVGFVSESWWTLEVWKIWGCHFYLLNLLRGSFDMKGFWDLENLCIDHCFSTRIKSIQYFNFMAAWSFERFTN